MCADLAAQVPHWQVLPNAPTRFGGGRHEDVMFIDTQTGWVVNGIGETWRTTNGGTNWQLMATLPNYIRCVAFADANRGWIGMLFSGNEVMYQTTNGGITWTPQSFTGDAPKGICGLWAADANHIYGVGPYSQVYAGGGPHFVKTTNGGAEWISKDMSDLVTGLVDVRFTNKDSGFAVGQGGAYPNTTTVVLFTADGGTTWQTRYTSTKTGIWSWKISFPTRDTGYVSTQGYSDSTTFLKTVDGGLTWKESTFLSRAGSKQFSAEGIGFVTPSLGWIGAYPSSSYLMDSYRTTNGGATWNIDTFGKSLNRFRMFGDTLGYAVGETVYKYTNETLAASTPAKNASPSGYELRQNYPNPFNPATTIAYELPKAAAVSLKVYDVIGREVASLVNERKAAGRYEVRFDGSKLASGIYMYRLIAGDYVEVREMVFLK